MVGTWTYSPNTNTITVTGGTVGAPAGFVDAWNADKAGTLTLKAATTPALNMTLTTQIKPTDEVALKIDFVLAGTSAGAGDTIDITGTDKDDGVQTETLDVSAGNGTYTTTKWFKTITDIDCNGFNDGTLTVTQGQWGVVWKFSNNQFQFDVQRIDVGNGSTATYFTDTKKQVTFPVASGGGIMSIKANAILTLGTLLNAARKTTADGCSILSTVAVSGTSGIALVYDDSVSGLAYLYGCFFSSIRPAFIKPSHASKIYNCIGDNVNVFIIDTGDYYNYQVYNFKLYSNPAAYIILTATATMDGLKAFECTNGVYAQGSNEAVIPNPYFRGLTYIGRFYIYTGNMYLINVDTDAWTFNWVGVQSGIVYRQYEFDLTVTDVAGTAIASATVTLKDKDGNTVFSLTTDANGNITTQTVSRGYYNQANGNTLQEYSPHTLTISKAGYITYTEIFTLSAKTTWTISLLDELSGTADTDDVLSGETFYKNSYASQLTGTLALTGDALTIDVADKKTFYNTDPKTKLTGTKIPDPNKAITKQDYDRIVKEEVEPYQMATAVLLLQRQRDKRVIKALNNE